MTEQINLLSAEIQLKLPEHTFKAVMARTEGMSDQEKLEFLQGVLARRERSEAFDRQRSGGEAG